MLGEFASFMDAAASGRVFKLGECLIGCVAIAINQA